ncbi:MAG: stage III sporulation protein AD [Firmicutes bacterium]|nr:stage III sporulation protein AD [Bacillota bacterium]
MEIIKIAGIGIISTFAFLLIKESRPEIAYLVAVAGGIVILIMVADYLIEVVARISNLSGKTGLGGGIISAVLKIIGVGYITEFAGSVCEDAGSKSLAEKVRFGGKTLILFLSLPILTAVVDIVASLLAGV